MIAKLICFFKGHKRGRRVAMVTATSTIPVNTFECPRCGATWTRKAKVRA